MSRKRPKLNEPARRPHTAEMVVLDAELEAHKLLFLALGGPSSGIRRMNEVRIGRDPEGKRVVVEWARAWVRQAKKLKGRLPGSAPKAVTPPMGHSGRPRLADLDEQNRRAQEFFNNKAERLENQKKAALQASLDRKSSKSGTRPKKTCKACSTPVLDHEDYCFDHVPR